MIFSNLSRKLSPKLSPKFSQKLPTKFSPNRARNCFKYCSQNCPKYCTKICPQNVSETVSEIDLQISNDNDNRQNSKFMDQQRLETKKKDLNGRKEGCYFEKSRNLESVDSFSIPKIKTIIVIAVLIINGVIFDLMRNRTPFLSLKYLHISLCHFIHTRQPS